MLGPWFRVRGRYRRTRPDQIDYWEQLQLLYNKISLTMAPEAHGAQVLPDPIIIVFH
jgi:hypothetical protein